MDLILFFIVMILYMFITYHVIALKYTKSRAFSGFRAETRALLVAIHVWIVISNILLYFWLVWRDYNPPHIILRAAGILMFSSGLFIIFWGIHSLRKAVFVPENRVIVSGPFAFVRHPMYFGGITGAIGLALIAGSLLGLVYSFFLALVLSHISNAEEKDLEARFGMEYAGYKKKVPKLFPRAW
ncbi:MAG: isoprenylcysteine carboxylmethyltransferase family protein [Candidatus Methanoperedens sp.]|nr:isoprenylcysteine carboxylmethyltransferase family protein [Candidatus Methanoperedens sp.]